MDEPTRTAEDLLQEIRTLRQRIRELESASLPSHRGAAFDGSGFSRAEEQSRILLKVVEQSPVSIVITDVEGGIEYVNPFLPNSLGSAPRRSSGGHPASSIPASIPPNAIL